MNDSSQSKLEQIPQGPQQEKQEKKPLTLEQIQSGIEDSSRELDESGSLLGKVKELGTSEAETADLTAEYGSLMSEKQTLQSELVGQPGTEAITEMAADELLNHPELIDNKQAIDKVSELLIGLDNKIDLPQEAWDMLPSWAQKLGLKVTDLSGAFQVGLSPLDLAVKLGLLDMKGESTEEHLQKEEESLQIKEKIISMLPEMKALKPFLGPLKKLRETRDDVYLQISENVKKARVEKEAAAAQGKKG